MGKMSINDAAEHFGISKEAIHNRIRRGSLVSIVEDGVKLVIIDEKISHRTPQKASILKPTLSDDRYYRLLEEQNARLQSRVEALETETRSLRDQKEQMLIQERIKIENIYKEKDEQLKNILSSISAQFMLNAPEPLAQVSHVEAEIEEEMDAQEEFYPETKLISLKKYLKDKNFSEKKSKKIKDKFKKNANADERIVSIGEKLYLDIKKYDYSDLF